MTAARREHLCAGLCGRVLPRRRVACLICWRRLPDRFRRAISGTDRTRWATWTAAVAAASAWYRHHPPKSRHRVTPAALTSSLPPQPDVPGVIPHALPTSDGRVPS